MCYRQTNYQPVHICLGEEKHLHSLKLLYNLTWMLRFWSYVHFSKMYQSIQQSQIAILLHFDKPC